MFFLVSFYFFGGCQGIEGTNGSHAWKWAKMHHGKGRSLTLVVLSRSWMLYQHLWSQRMKDDPVCCTVWGTYLLFLVNYRQQNNLRWEQNKQRCQIAVTKHHAENWSGQIKNLQTLIKHETPRSNRSYQKCLVTQREPVATCTGTMTIHLVINSAVFV